MSLEFKHIEMFPEKTKASWLIPESVEELASMVRDHDRLGIGGSNGYRLVPHGRGSTSYSHGELKATLGPKERLTEAPSHKVLLDKLDQMLWFSPENQLVSVQSGISLFTLNEFLRSHGYEIPIGLRDNDQDECVGDMIALNLPHWNLATGGSWRDWVVKMVVVLASGEVVKSGADVVKNVTGFDLHKLIIGARSTLGVIGEVTLRIRPKSEPKEYPPIKLNHGILVKATSEGLDALRDHLADRLSGEYPMQHYFDEEGGLALVETTFAKNGNNDFDHRPYGFVWRSDVGACALHEFSDAEKKLMIRTKEIFDAGYKLNPGEFGFL